MNVALKDKIKSQYPNVTIMLASKYLTKKADFIPFIKAGITHFGENRVEAFLDKKAWLKEYPITWHFIGTLQTKKVKKIVNEIDVLQSLDRIKLAREIEKRRQGVLPCYIEVNISNEANKHGLKVSDVPAFLETIKDFKHLNVIGLMGMATHTDDKAVIKNQFDQLKALRDTVSKTHKDITELSIGMSNDYEIALDTGSTILRLGRIMIERDAYES